MDTLHHTVGSRVVSGGNDVGNIEEGGEGGPEAVGEFWAVVRGDVGRNNEAGDPGLWRRLRR